MVIIPADAATEITTEFGAIVAANALVVVGVLAVGIGVAFVMRWFNKSTRRLKA